MAFMLLTALLMIIRRPPGRPAAEVVRLQPIRRAARGPMRHPSSGYRLACDAIDQVEALLGNDAYLTGERLSTADCSIWAHLIHTAVTPTTPPLAAPGR